MEIFGFDTDKCWDYENGFYLTSHPSRLAKALAQYELYKMILKIPGDVVECGVYKGASLIRWLTYREILEGAEKRRIIGFDTFDGFHNPINKKDKEFVDKFIQEGGIGISPEELKKLLWDTKDFGNFGLRQHDIRNIPERQDSDITKIALLHVDLDVYDATRTCLELFWDKIVKDGLCVLDDYDDVLGATRAIDEFFADKDVKFEGFSISPKPIFVRKP
jgi:hypothetical protein